MSLEESVSNTKTNIVDSQTYSGIMLKKVHVADLSKTYGPRQRGIVADEKIKKGELILQNDPVTSMFYPFDDKRCSYTFEEYYQLLNEQQDPDIKKYLSMYSLPCDDKNVFVPRNYLTRDTMDLTALLNHSCEANVTSRFTDQVIALQDIEPGTVLTVDYGIGLTADMKLLPFDTCRCGTPSCAGANVFQRYKQPDWQTKFYDYCSPYVKEKIDEIRKQQVKS
ncbi:hypothetical protein I4U23_022405 [Adineta vaga]|nr:hypothetical protein I4U23_022405 [Adineta vaga]